ncbi:TPR-like protein [Sistotremastrum niveocremeum HHB9708]|uniref:TPR-like protein n=1 Tax=Sistotremastrum niveocremeum HHB9708 TaxID=1314777 RepID=A0A164VZY5_9AGAM|nr:TPR-like protein [Sistotremastrum niveocremeum HHB9708]
MPVPPPPDPAVLAAIEQDYKPVPLKLNENQVLCDGHGLEKCGECEVDFVAVNQLAKMIVSHPEYAVPPPPNMIPPQRSQAVSKAKEEGNSAYKARRYPQALHSYTIGASIAAARPSWEHSQVSRDEISILLSNRAAAYFEAGEFMNSLVDTEAVIAIRKPWSKGHYRKGKALLGLGKGEEARDAILTGLSYEPTNQELLTFLAEIENKIGRG